MSGIDRARIRDHLLDLIRIDSLSKREGAIAERLRGELSSLGVREIEVDGTGERIGGETGNLIARVEGTVDVEPLLLSAHMDTVPPGEGVVPVLDGDVIRSDGRTVLGGDDKSGIAIIVEILRVLLENDVPHGPLDVVFTVCEERGLQGAKHLEIDRLRARKGVVLDSDAPGVLFTRAPGANAIRVVVHGTEAHAGMAPEKGVSAIAVAAEAIAGMPLGRIDDETTTNLGTIHGGQATNIVPNRLEILGEARSHDEAKLVAVTEEIRRRFEAAAERASHPNGPQSRVEIEIERDYDAMDVPDDSLIVRLLVEAGVALGRSMTVTGMGGGCDANVLNRRGFEVANLGTGMREIHTVHEWLDVNDMVLAAEVLLEAVRRHANPP